MVGDGTDVIGLYLHLQLQVQHQLTPKRHLEVSKYVHRTDNNMIGDTDTGAVRGHRFSRQARLGNLLKQICVIFPDSPTSIKEMAWSHI